MRRIKHINRKVKQFTIVMCAVLLVWGVKTFFKQSPKVVIEPLINQPVAIKPIEKLEALSTEAYNKFYVNELGSIPILVYHKIVSDPRLISGDDKYSISTETFKRHMQRLCDTSFTPISLADYHAGHIQVPYGKRPFVLTFDGGYVEHFKVLATSSADNLMVDETSVVGILEQFNKTCQFNAKATFYLPSHNFFEYDSEANVSKLDKALVKEKLTWLLDRGYTIGNYTKSQIDLSKIITIDVIEEELSAVPKRLDMLSLNAQVDSVVLPYSKLPRKELEHNLFEGQGYHHMTAMMAGGVEISPFDSQYSKPIQTQYSGSYLSRIVAHDIDNAFEIMLDSVIKPGIGFVSYGFHHTIVIPSYSKAILNPLYQDTKEIIQY